MKLVNNGPDRVIYVWIRMPATVHHTGASTDGGGGCGPGGDASTVKCGWGLPNYFEAGQTRTVTIKTDAPYPNDGGADLFVGNNSNGPMTPAGKATGPTGPCTCVTFEARLIPKTIAFVNPGDTTGMLMQMTFAWTMNCTTGTGKCAGQFDLLPPQPARKLKTRFQPIGAKINCVGPCGGVTTGTKTMKLYGGPTLAFGSRGKKVKSMKITVRRTCQSKKTTDRVLTIVFNRLGQVDKKKSDWNGDKKPG